MEQEDSTGPITEILSDILESSTKPSTSAEDKTEAANAEQENVSSSTPSKSVEQDSDLKFSSQPSNSNNTIGSNESKNDSRKINVDNIPLEKITVKEIINEILDCTVLRKLPTVSQVSERNLAETTLAENLDVGQYYLEPLQIPVIRSRPEEAATCSKMQYTAKEIINEILDYTVFKKSVTSNSYQRESANEFSIASSSHYQQGQEELGANLRQFQIYRATGPGIINSANHGLEEVFLQKPMSRKSTNKLLPSYSTVLKLGPPKVRSFHSSLSFVPKLPPPSYAEVEGLWEDNPSTISSESMVFGPDPAYIVCPRCRVVVVTDIAMERSNMTHLAALVMCLCMCWPCCLLPYCLRSCNYTYHTCPNCRHYFGMYRPF